MRWCQQTLQWEVETNVWRQGRGGDHHNPASLDRKITMGRRGKSIPIQGGQSAGQTREQRLSTPNERLHVRGGIPCNIPMSRRQASREVGGGRCEEAVET